MFRINSVFSFPFLFVRESQVLGDLELVLSEQHRTSPVQLAKMCSPRKLAPRAEATHPPATSVMHNLLAETNTGEE